MSSYVDEAGKQIVVSGETDNTVELVGGSELLITEKSENTTTSKTLGSREFMRYYRQKPRPTSQDSNQIIASLSSRFVFSKPVNHPSLSNQIIGKVN